MKAGSIYSSLLKAFHLVGEIFVDSVNEDAYIDIALNKNENLNLCDFFQCDWKSNSIWSITLKMSGKWDDTQVSWRGSGFCSWFFEQGTFQCFLRYVNPKGWIFFSLEHPSPEAFPLFISYLTFFIKTFQEEE